MPTYLRLIIMLGEIVGLLIFSFVRCKQHIKVYKKDKYNAVCRSDLKVSIVYYSICNIIILFIFTFSFPSYIFLSYNKLILITIAVITSFLPYVFIIKLEKYMLISAILFFLLVVGMVSTVVITVFSFCAPEELIQFKIYSNEENNIEKINPEINLTSKSKIGHYLDDSGDIDNYIFFYQDSNNNWHKVDEPIENRNTQKISTDENSYVEKYVTTKTILNVELDESDKNYITTEKTISYKLYYNPIELMEITD